MKLPAILMTACLACVAANPEADKAKSLGNPGAPVEVEIFASFDCPHCKELHERMVPQLMKDYVVPGKVFLVNREFPLTGPYHPYAQEAAQYAVAAGRVGKYQQVAEALFNNQAAWAVNG